ncbi:unnamed protein product [Acanthoscelides obtectus]|jgi:8-oxo-dGTP diphosphatase
MVL